MAEKILKILNQDEKEVEEIFRSAVMRVPMDSISGAQVLKFSYKVHVNQL